MKTTKKVFSFLILLVLVNLTSWYLVGRFQTITIFADQFENYNYQTLTRGSGLDTLFFVVEPNPQNNHNRFIKSFDTYKIQEQKMLDKLNNIKTLSKVVGISRDGYFQSASNSKYPLFDFEKITSFPLYIEFETFIIYGEASNSYLGNYFYFFGWRKLSPTFRT